MIDDRRRSIKGLGGKGESKDEWVMKRERQKGLMKSRVNDSGSGGSFMK